MRANPHGTLQALRVSRVTVCDAVLNSCFDTVVSAGAARSIHLLMRFSVAFRGLAPDDIGADTARYRTGIAIPPRE